MSQSTSDNPNQSKIASSYVLLFGVFLPVVTLAVETGSRMCAQDLFNPIPTWMHWVLIALVPVINLWIWWGLCKGRMPMRWAGLLSGLTIGITSFYTLLFLPIIPIGLIGIVVFGMGFLPLSPLLSLIAAILLRWNLKKLNDGPVPGLFLGLALALSILLGSEFRSTYTRYAMQQAVSTNGATQTTGIKRLRSWGDKKILLSSCYISSNRGTNLFGFILAETGKTPSTNEARGIYYRVTGHAFNSVSAPDYANNEGLMRGGRDFDPGQGGTSVAGRVKHLSMQHSRMDASIDGLGVLGYLEWTMVFKNEGKFMQLEARAQVALPPGGVVSRLTLWVNGEEREAAFAKKSQVREAYQKVVRRRRDPVLVTQAGPDRVLMQCFPVPPKGEMKIRMGITFPLKALDDATSTFVLPCLVEQNFSFAPTLQHAVWLESKQDIQTVSKQLKRTVKDEKTIIRGDLLASEDTLSGHVFKCDRVKNKTITWSNDLAHRSKIVAPKTKENTSPVSDPKGPAEGTSPQLEKEKSEGFVFRQEVTTTAVVAPEHILLVVDASKEMAEFKSNLAHGMEALAGKSKLILLIAKDEVKEGGTFDLASPERITALKRTLEDLSCEGGMDNVSALQRAFDIAYELESATIIWVHGPQPVELGPLDSLRQFLNRSGGSTLLYHLPVKEGPNRIIEGLKEYTRFSRMERAGLPEVDLSNLGKRWNNKMPTYVVKRERMPLKDQATLIASHPKTSGHLARLWALDEVKRRLAQQKVDEAIALAASYQLVTRVTGAVVLENQAQFDEAGLSPVDAGTVPTIPEPETWLLMVSMALLLFFFWMKKRRVALAKC